MYLPAEFREENSQRLIALMRRYPFALLVCGAELPAAPQATALPLLVEEEESGLYIRGHVARNNPHAAALAGREGLAVFQGPHALIDSAWYVSEPQVGTWNYVMVQASGPITLLDDAAAQRVARTLTRTLTPDAPPIPPEFEAKMLRGVTTFELRVTRLEGKFKLSQNKSAADREAVRAQLEGSERDGDRAVAQLMAPENTD
jgi:transcriptional regulator